MPGLRVARTYQPSWLAKDLLAGIVLSALLVPQGMAYAEMAGLPTITGLYATVVCLLAYLCCLTKPPPLPPPPPPPPHPPPPHPQTHQQQPHPPNPTTHPPM